jgi:release factor glutamine methyltransferase
VNHLLADNKVSTLRSYLLSKLSERYGEREASNIVHALFDEYHGWSRAELILRAADRMGESELLRYHFALKRLMQGEPLQYVLGIGWFMGMRFQTTPAALIPRPETEELVRLIAQENSNPKPRLLDIGTGSGCIAIGLKKLIPQADITALDVSREALQLAQLNAQALQAEISFEELDILQASPQGTFDVIVSNPPYIPANEMATMAAHVTEHEPHLALFTPNNDALLFYRRIFSMSRSLLSEEGKIYFEIHEDQADALRTLTISLVKTTPEFHIDLQGKTRMMSCSLKPTTS